MHDFAPRGSILVRAAIAQALSADHTSAQMLAATRWGKASATVEYLKAAVAAGGSTTWAEELIGVSDFVEAADEQSILGRLRDLRRVPAGIPYATITTGAQGYWRGEGQPARVSAMAFSRDTLQPRDVSVLVAVAAELMKTEGARAEALIRAEVLRAAGAVVDRGFLDPDNAGDSTMPASITHGATEIAGTGDLAADLGAALEAFGGDLETAAWIINPANAARIGLQAGGRGVAADLGARGGSLGGLPVFVSAGLVDSTDGPHLVLMDQAGIAVVDEGARISVSRDAVVQMSDDPIGDSAPLVSLWQRNLVGLIVHRYVNWHAARPDSVVVITGASYGASV
jgi:HK97 family phage major capsid protein